MSGNASRWLKGRTPLAAPDELSEIPTMHPFIETLSLAGGFAAALVAAIVLLTLFYRGLAWLSRDTKPSTLAVRGVLQPGTLATVHLVWGTIFENVHVIGFTGQESIKTHLPMDLQGMVILEDASKVRTLIRAKDIRMIVVSSPAEPSGSAEPNS